VNSDDTKMCSACGGLAKDWDMEVREWVSLPGDTVARGWFHRDERDCRAEQEPDDVGGVRR